MTTLALLLGTIFCGLSFLAVHVNALPPVATLLNAEQIAEALKNGRDVALGETVVSQIGRAVFGKSFLYIALQIVTCIILILAANTSFAGISALVRASGRGRLFAAPTRQHRRQVGL